MKIYLFVIALSFISCKNAIKNEVKSDLMASNEIVSNERVNKPIIVNNSKVINSKEDLIGCWVYDFKDYDENKYYGKFIFSFSKVDKNKIFGKLFINQKQIPIVMDLAEGDKKITIAYQSNSKNIPFKKIAFDIKKGTEQLEGKAITSDPEIKIDYYKIEMTKKNFVYDIDGLVEDMYVDDDKTGIGYRDYDLVEEVVVDKEILKGADSIAEKPKKEEVKLKPTRIEREGYFATTSEIFKINPSKEVIKKEVVENLSKADLYILNKLVYAKHGLIFKDKKLSEYFLNHSWYVPVSNNVDSYLTEIEKKNIDLLGRYERNAKEYYAVFGR